MADQRTVLSKPIKRFKLWTRKVHDASNDHFGASIIVCFTHSVANGRVSYSSQICQPVKWRLEIFRSISEVRLSASTCDLRARTFQLSVIIGTTDLVDISATYTFIFQSPARFDRRTSEPAAASGTRETSRNATRRCIIRQMKNG